MPLVHCTAVGINFNWRWSEQSDQRLTPARLLGPGDWSHFDEVEAGASVQLIHKLGGKTVNTSIKMDVNPENEKPCILFEGNFHRDIKSDPAESYMVAMGIVDKWEEDLQNYCNLVEAIINKGVRAS